MDRSLVSLAGRAALAAAVGLMAVGANAAGFPVTTTADTGAGSLREAILGANASADAENTINFSPTSPGTISVLTPFANIGTTLTIDGAGATPTELLVIGQGAGTALYQVDNALVLTLIDAPLDSGDIVLGTGSGVVFDTSVAQLVDQAIRDAVGGSGTLEKLGDAELTLTGLNTYTGGTTVSAGTLVVTSTSLPSDAVISGTGTLAFDETGGTPTFAGALSGGGRVEKRGTSALTLTGNNSYTGGTSVLEGALLGGLSSIRGPIDVASDATVELIANGGVDETLTEAVTGAGTLHKNGPDRLILEGDNTIAMLRVLQGTLTGDTSAISGETLVDAGATLEIASDTNGTIASPLTGAGSLFSTGTGVVTLSGINTISVLTVTDGRLNATSPESLPNAVTVTTPGTVSFNPAVDGTTYSGTITGTGDLQKRGSNTIRLDTAHTFTGTTRIFNGGIELTGSLASPVQIDSGASLSGGGTVNGLVTNSGTLFASPGARPVVDALTLATGSILDVTVEPGLALDLATVNNAASLAAGTLDVTLTPGSYAPLGESFTLVRAGTLVSLPSFDSQSLFFDLALAQAGQDLILSVTPNGARFADFATNRNQAAVAGSLDAERPTATADLTSVIQAIETLGSSAQAAAAYDALGGEQLSQFTTARLELADRFDRSVQARLRERGDGLRLEPREATNELPSVSFGGEPLDTAFWLEPFGVFGSIDGRQGAHETDYRLAGITLGADATPFADTRVGAAFSYGHTSLGYDGLGGRGDGHSYLGALYGGWSTGPFRIGLSTRVSYSQLETLRRIDINTLQRRAKADFDGLDAGGRLELGYKLLERERFLVEPYVAAGYTYLNRSGVSETGAGAVNLRIERETLNSATVSAGLRARGIVRIDDDLIWYPELHSEWSQQLADRDRDVGARFQDAQLTSFTVRGTELHRNSGVTGISWVVRNSRGLGARLGYDVGYDADRVAHGIGVAINAAW